MIVQRPVAVLLALLGGLVVIVQNGVNTRLHQDGIKSPFATAGVSYTVGFMAITIISVIDRPPKCSCGGRSASNSNEELTSSLRGFVKEAPWFAYCGGPLGAVYVTAAILLTARLGFATFQLSVTLGQLLSSMTCDAIGFLHLSKTPTTPWRVSCLLLLALGTAMSSDSSSKTTTTSSDEDATSPWLWPVFIAGAILAGCVFPVQSCVNFELAQHVGTPFRAVVVNFATGALSVWFLTLISYLLARSNGNDTSTIESFLFYTWPPQIPLYEWLGGGMMGATLITCAVIGLPSLGAVAFTGIFISTQLLVATIFDATGAFGLDVVAVGARRACGVLLAMVAAAAFQQSPPASMPWLSSWPSSSTSREARASGTAEENRPLLVFSERWSERELS